jgi:hypothetical protein
MLKTFAFIKIYLLVFLFVPSLINSDNLSNDSFKYLIFDFGSKETPLGKYSIMIDSAYQYDEGRGYGLLNKNYSTYYDQVLEKITNQITCDGISSKDSIEFRVDISPGNYIIEILMHGGERTIWEGSIAINNNAIATRLLSYSASYEGQSPPPYWGLVSKIHNNQSHLIIKIKSDKQPSTLAGISIYSENFGPIKNIEGNAVAVNKMMAPNAALCLDLINAAKILEAKRIIDAIPIEFRFEKSLLLFALASRIEVPNPRDYIETAYYYLKDEAEVNQNSDVMLNMRLAELILNGNQFYNIAGWLWNNEIFPHSGFFNYINIAGDSYEEASAIPEHPLFLAATWLKAKTAYWILVEQHEPQLIELADKYFNILIKFFPQNDLLKEYMGKRKYDVNDELKMVTIPEWAYLQNKVSTTMLDIIYYWVNNRQAINGEFGGKFDDDCEMLRWWPISRIVFGDTTALKGMKRLVDGIWNSEWIYKGFSKKVRDVEHSSEPVADTQPMMIGFDYGNPVYVERCMESVKGIRDLWTGINSKGHRHFKSSWYSSTEIDTTAPKDCDLEMNIRTVKTALWLAWYNRHPFVMNFLKEWGDAWLEDCLRTDKGKPKGIVPAAIRFLNDEIGGHSDNWHHPNMFWDYFNYSGGARILSLLLLNSIFFDDDRYLEPIYLSMELIKKYDGIEIKSAQVGSEEWTVNILRNSDNFWEVIELWRLYKNNKKYDDLIMQVGSPYIKYYLSKKDFHLVEPLKAITNDLVNNYKLNTTEGYFTDRVELRDMREGDSRASGLMEAMYTGSSLVDAAYPFNRISWKGFNKNLSALITEATSSSIKIKTFIHSQKAAFGEIFFLDFIPGVYTIKIGIDLDGDLNVDSQITEDSFTIFGRNSYTSITLSPGIEQIVEIKLAKKSLTETTSLLPDLAVTKEELIITNIPGENLELTVPVHNIGIKESEKTDVVLFRINDLGKEEEIKSAAFGSLVAPLDLEAKVRKVSLQLKNWVSGNYKIWVDPTNKVQELNEGNNFFYFTL